MTHEVSSWGHHLTHSQFQWDSFRLCVWVVLYQSVEVWENCVWVVLYQSVEVWENCDTETVLYITMNILQHSHLYGMGDCTYTHTYTHISTSRFAHISSVLLF